MLNNRPWKATRPPDRKISRKTERVRICSILKVKKRYTLIYIIDVSNNERKIRRNGGDYITGMLYTK